MYNIDLPSTTHSITENLLIAMTHLDTAYTLYCCTYVKLVTVTKWLCNCTYNVALSSTFTIASTYVHAHLFVCFISQCRILRCRRLAQETLRSESEGRKKRPVPLTKLKHLTEVKGQDKLL